MGLTMGVDENDFADAIQWMKNSGLRSVLPLLERADVEKKVDVFSEQERNMCFEDGYMWILDSECVKRGTAHHYSGELRETTMMFTDAGILWREAVIKLQMNRHTHHFLTYLAWKERRYEREQVLMTWTPEQGCVHHDSFQGVLCDKDYLHQYQQASNNTSNTSKTSRRKLREAHLPCFPKLKSFLERKNVIYKQLL